MPRWFILLFLRASFSLGFFAFVADGAADPVLVIYSGQRDSPGFALVRQTLSLDLRAGENEVRTAAITRNLDPASVILRSSSGGSEWRVNAQEFRNEPLSEADVLTKYVGQTCPLKSWNTVRNAKSKEKSSAGPAPELPSPNRSWKLTGKFDLASQGGRFFRVCLTTASNRRWFGDYQPAKR